MPSLRQGSIHLGRIAGVDLFLHWSWFLVAFIEVQNWRGRYSSILWSILEYLALFLIVLTHEFGHALACRQVGGTANRILLWPFGGVAYVNPPQRPGATLWSIAAGPLVNVALLPFLLTAYWLSISLGWDQTMPDVYLLVRAIVIIDLALLAFNILPFYPLDGGQILRSLLWFWLGRGRSLMVATVLGIVGIVGYFAVVLLGMLGIVDFFRVALFRGSLWLGAIGVFMLMNCWGGLKHAQALLKIAKLPRRPGFACPSCHTEPPLGTYWQCGKCRHAFDTFESRGVCPNCSTQYATTTCLDCGEQRPMSEWIVGAYAGGGVVNGGFPGR